MEHALFVGAVYAGAAGAVDPGGDAGQPVAGPIRPCVFAGGQRIADMDMHADTGECIDLEGDRRIRRMPASVGQPLLDGAVGDFAEILVQLAELLDVDPGVPRACRPAARR